MPTTIQVLALDSFQVSFPSQTTPGAYTISIGPDVADLDGYLMGQDDDGIDGEVEDDVYVFDVFAEQSQSLFLEDFELPDVWEIDNGIWELMSAEFGQF